MLLVRSLTVASLALWVVGIGLAIYAIVVTPIAGAQSRILIMIQSAALAGGVTLALTAVLALWVLGPRVAFEVGYQLGHADNTEVSDADAPE